VEALRGFAVLLRGLLVRLQPARNPIDVLMR
jgi:hypothetical protein